MPLKLINFYKIFKYIRICWLDLYNVSISKDFSLFLCFSLCKLRGWFPSCNTVGNLVNMLCQYILTIIYFLPLTHGSVCWTKHTKTVNINVVCKKHTPFQYLKLNPAKKNQTKKAWEKSENINSNNYKKNKLQFFSAFSGELSKLPYLWFW